MKKILFLILYFLSSFGKAEVACDNSVLKTDSLYDLPGAGYWMQALGDCRITYTAVGGTSSKMYNMCTRQAEQITRFIDAYGLPEGDLYVHPNWSGISFYKTSEALRSGAAARPFFDDNVHPGNYESIGILSNKGNERIIRIAMGNQGGSFKDYKITKTGEDDYEVKVLTKNPIQMCRNIPSGGLDRALPVLSRDGKYIAGRDNGTRLMKIYKFDPQDGQCTLVNDIPYVTSKVSFSFDNRHVLMVVNDPNTRKGRLLQMDIESGEFKTISSPLENVQYMTSKQNGEILYTRQNDKGDGRTSTLVKLSPDSIPDVSDSLPYEAIGMAWAKKCKMEVDLDYALAIGQRLKGQECLELADLADTKSFGKDYEKLKAGDLKKICSAVGTNSSSQSSSGSGEGRN